jgi:hypothetical protein
VGRDVAHRDKRGAFRGSLVAQFVEGFAESVTCLVPDDLRGHFTGWLVDCRVRRIVDNLDVARVRSERDLLGKRLAAAREERRREQGEDEEIASLHGLIVALGAPKVKFAARATAK